MFAKNLVFYTIASIIVSVVAQALGASMGVVLMSSLLIPPVLLLSVLLLRYNGWL
ncbi:MAG: hypothetical protein O2783_02840 [Chloroflexi bacterium]|nr:hypothetical protein [Chloroflexota bacterium]